MPDKRPRSKRYCPRLERPYFRDFRGIFTDSCIAFYRIGKRGNKFVYSFSEQDAYYEDRPSGTYLGTLGYFQD